MNDRFDDWLSENLPPAEADAAHSETQLAILKQRLRVRAAARRRGRRRTLLVVVPVLVVAVLVGSTSELGSDGFRIVRETHESVPGELARIGFRGTGMNIPDSVSDQQVRELAEQLDANEGRVVLVEGWMVDGKTCWNLTRELPFGDGTKEFSKTSFDPPSRYTRELGMFLIGEWRELRDSTALRAAPDGKERVELDGAIYEVGYWWLETSTLGRIKFYRFSPDRYR